MTALQYKQLMESCPIQPESADDRLLLILTRVIGAMLIHTDPVMAQTLAVETALWATTKGLNHS